MTQMLALAGFGFLLGMRHATDADHVIAVTTILNRSKRFLDTTLIGALWGLGHTITVVIVGVLIIVFNVVIPPPVGLAMEFAVALMLIGLGILNLTGGLRSLTERVTPPAPMHVHDHAHRGASHGHLHGHGENRGLVATLGRYQLIRPVVVGLVHGLAGSAAVALLPLAVLLMGSGAGSDPWGFLLTTPIGLACLAAGLALIALGLWWIERLADAAAAP